MAPQRILFPEWRDETKQIRYPFADSAACTNGALELPPWLFLDGRLYPVGGGARLHISKITKVASTVTFTLADETTELATAAYDVASPPANGELIFTDKYGRPAGMLLSAADRLSVFGAMGQGTYEFTVEQTEFAATVAVPQPNYGVRGIITDEGEILTGDVWLVGERGVVLHEEDGAIRVDIVGDPFASRAVCAEEEQQDNDVPDDALDPYCPIMTINGYSPDSYGVFHLMVGGNESLTNVLRIVPGSGNVLRFELLGERRFNGD